MQGNHFIYMCLDSCNGPGLYNLSLFVTYGSYWVINLTGTSLSKNINITNVKGILLLVQTPLQNKDTKAVLCLTFLNIGQHVLDQKNRTFCTG